MRRRSVRPTRRRTSTVSIGVSMVVSMLGSSTLLTGCFVGERPTLRDEPIVDDAAARTVFDRLALATSAAFVATYRIAPTGVGDEVTATVTVASSGYEVRVGDVEYRVEPGAARTCTLSSGACVDDIDDARLSNLGVTHRFWGEAFRTRLGLDAARRIGFTEASNDTVAGAPAACVDITVPSSVEASGTVRYCALDAGPLARYVGADVVIELTEFTPTLAG